MEKLRSPQPLYVKSWKSLLKSNPELWPCELHRLKRSVLPPRHSQAVTLSCKQSLSYPTCLLNPHLFPLNRHVTHKHVLVKAPRNKYPPFYVLYYFAFHYNFLHTKCLKDMKVFTIFYLNIFLQRRTFSPESKVVRFISYTTQGRTSFASWVL